MPPETFFEAVQNTARAVRACNILGIPVVETRQYPKGLGDTAAEIKKEIKSDAAGADKLRFSAYCAPEVNNALSGKANIATVLISGMEAHICVLQTALDLLTAGFAVHVLSDASVSRTENRRQQGFDFMRQAGAVITNTETAIYQLTGGADNPLFRQISAIMR